MSVVCLVIAVTCYIESVWFYCICVQVYDRSKLYYSCRFMQDNMAQMIATLDLQDLLKNGIRRSTSSPALAARKAANDLLECMSEDSNAGRLELFSLSVVQLLDKAIHPDSAHTQAGHEKMWGLFHSIQTSHEYKHLCTTFLEELMVNATPFLFQTTTDKLFQKRIDYHVPLQDVSPSLGEVVGSILTNEDVLFHWCMVCCDVPEELSNELLKRIVELWTTLRGFSFAKSYMEMYKRTTKKILQRSKALSSARTSSQPLPRYIVPHIILYMFIPTYHSKCNDNTITNL